MNDFDAIDLAEKIEVFGWHCTCPTCNGEMKELEDLASTLRADVLEWPALYWCLVCGTIRTKGDKPDEWRIFVPARMIDSQHNP